MQPPMAAALLGLMASATAAASALPYSGTNNLAFAAPHVQMPHLAVPFPAHRRLWVDASCDASDSVAFKHGVASGDPESSSVVLWTKVSSSATDSPEGAVYDISYKVASDPDMQHVVDSGRAYTTADVDYTVKVIAHSGLIKPATKYYYQFSACNGSVYSAIGQTKTAPEYYDDPESVTFATLSCSQYSYASFVVYKNLAAHADEIDAVLFLGDYIYEYGNVSPQDAKKDWFSAAQSREPVGDACIPPTETLTLSDYRARHAQYKTDPDLQEAHRLLTWIVVPDDHEVANDGWEGGAEDHTPGVEGDWQTRVGYGLRAWFEYIPVRQFTQDNQRVYRDFKYGKRVHLMMLDTRYNERQQQPKPPTVATYSKWVADAEQRTIMSDTQMQWLINGLQSTDSQWKVIGNQIAFVDIINPAAGADPSSVFPDQWIAYKKSQQALLDGIENVPNVVIHTGDIHTAFAMEAFEKSDGNPYAVEYIATSVTSAGFGEFYTDGLGYTQQQLEGVAQALLTNPLMAYVKFCHGYHIAQYSASDVKVDFYCANDIHDPTAHPGEYVAASFRTCDGSSKVVDASAAQC